MEHTYYSEGFQKPDEDGKISFKNGVLSLFKVPEKDLNNFKREHPYAEEINENKYLELVSIFKSVSQ